MWLPWTALLASPASGAALALGALAGYRGYFDQVAGSELQEHLFEQQVRAELDTALLRRSLAAWNVGFALDHTLTLGPQDATRVLATEYDTELRVWEGGTLPVRLYGGKL